MREWVNNNKILYTLCFSDDQIVFALGCDELEYTAQKPREEYSKLGLEVNIKKTEFCIRGVQQDLILQSKQRIR